MKEIVWVVAATTLAFVLAETLEYCRDPMAGWRRQIEEDCAKGVAEFNRVYKVDMNTEEAVPVPRWMLDK